MSPCLFNELVPGAVERSKDADWVLCVKSPNVQNGSNI